MKKSLSFERVFKKRQRYQYAQKTYDLRARRRGERAAFDSAIAFLAPPVPR
jgi:hypothetical protein